MGNIRRRRARGCQDKWPRPQFHHALLISCLCNVGQLLGGWFRLGGGRDKVQSFPGQPGLGLRDFATIKEPADNTEA